MSTSEEAQPLPTLSEKVRPIRTNARESKEVNAKIFELVVNQMKLETEKDGTGKKREGMSLRDRLRKKKQEEQKKDEEKEPKKKRSYYRKS